MAELRQKTRCGGTHFNTAIRNAEDDAVLRTEQNYVVTPDDKMKGYAMIDFSKNLVFKLSQVDPSVIAGKISPLLIPGETIISAYKGLRDFLAFTTKRIIVVDIQGVIGKKQDFTSLPYSKIQAFSVESTGVFDLDADVELSFAGLGVFHLEFSRNSNTTEICRFIAERVL